MSSHFFMGAINKTNNNHEYPKIASKKYKYKCPECEKDVIFRNGKIKKPHFAHYKSDNPCTYYDRPSESQIHKEAKMIMKYFLDNKKYINIYRKCYYCNDEDDVLFISDEDYNDEMKVVIEYKFNFNDSLKSADVALLENNKLMYIFEICYKNKTKEENRPEPWFELDATNLINMANTQDEFDIECIRNHYKCSRCKYIQEERNKIQYEISNMEKEDNYSNDMRYFFKHSESINKLKKKYEELKTLIKQILEMKIKFVVERTCKKCNEIEEFYIPKMTDTSEILFDCDVKYNNSKMKADVVYRENNDIISIFQIYSIYKNNIFINYHEPWFMINVDIIDKFNYMENSIFNISDIVNRLIIEKSTFKLECIRNELCEECVENNKCDGRGNCLTQSTCGYSKRNDILCSHNCLLKKCPMKYCKTMLPQWVLDCHSGKCLNCNMGIEPKRIIYLYVPYDRKDEAKILGAKWWSNGKKWIIESNHYNKNKLLELFDEVCPNY